MSKHKTGDQIEVQVPLVNIDVRRYRIVRRISASKPLTEGDEGKLALTRGGWLVRIGTRIKNVAIFPAGDKGIYWTTDAPYLNSANVQRKNVLESGRVFSRKDLTDHCDLLFIVEPLD